MHNLRTYSAFFVVLGCSLCFSGCKQAASPAAAPVKNADGTVTNPNGSVTVPAPATAATQPVRNSDGSVTNPDGSVTYPAGSSLARRETSASIPATVPAAGPAPKAATPLTAATPAAQRISAPAGTAVIIRLNTPLSASRNEPGDRFSGVLDRAIIAHGQTVFAAGTAVSGEVVASKGKGRFKGAGDLGIELTAIGRERVSTTEYEKVSPGRGKRTAVFAGGGAGVGALIGGLAGGGKGALIGGLAGGGAGTAAGAYTGSRDVVLPAESLITFRLTQAVAR